MNNKNVKKRNWAFILYPESAPSDWFQQIEKTGLTFSVSPLHDKDLNADNTFKKAHYHIILAYNGPTSFNVVNSLCDSLGQPHPQPLEQIRGYYRYFTHKDNPEKFQYDEKNIKSGNGFNIVDFVELTNSEVANIKKELTILIQQLDFIEYSHFIDYIRDNSQPEYFNVATNNTYFFDRYITSRRNSCYGIQRKDNNDD